MSSVTPDTVKTGLRQHDWSSEAHMRRVRRRYAANRRLQFYGLLAIALAVGMLGTLLVSLGANGYKAFYQSKAVIDVFVDPKAVDPEKIKAGNYRRLFNQAVLRYFPGVKGKDEDRLLAIFSSESRFILRDYVVAHPGAIGKTVKVSVPLSDGFDQYLKGVIPSHVAALGGSERELYRVLKNRNLIEVTGTAAHLKVNVFIDPAQVNRENIDGGNFETIIEEGARALAAGTGNADAVKAMLADSAADTLKAYVAARPETIGKTVENVPLPLSDTYAKLARGQTPMTLNQRFASEKQFEWLGKMQAQGLIYFPFAWELLLNADSRFPEQAGLAGAALGSFYALLVCFVIAFPMGIAAAVYLEEFAPTNRFTYLVEVNINNLAAVPSVVFGLLGLALFLNIFGLPRSVPLAGGMVLALMTLPTIIITTRAALKAVPPSIREAALGIGASRHQVVLHHVLPLAMPGVLTGTIIGMARALGETAPLLLIGMNAFIPSISDMGIMEPATSLPTQIYSWADSPERGFVARTSAAILVLLGFLIAMNAVAILLRQRFERKW